jgi:hypothetical protein
MFSLARTVPGISTYFQRIVPFNQLTISQYPVLFQRQVSEEVIQTHEGLPSHYKCMVDYILCASTPIESGVDPCSILNPLVDQFEAVFSDLNYQLGNVLPNVERIVIEGSLGYFETMIDPNQVSCIAIPVSVYCT